METFIHTKKNYINLENLAEPKRGVLFIDFIKKTVAKKSRRMKKSYTNNYKTLIWNLNNFSEQCNAELFVESINEDFLDDFIIWLESKMLKRTYIRNMIDLTKAMVRRAAIYGYAVDQTYDNVEVESEEIPSVYLSQNEIARIYYYNGLTKKQERIRDLFIVGCYTALRYSDLSTLKNEDFNNGFIYKLTKKNNIRVVIPVHDFVNEILNKYNGNVPNGITSQHFNRYIKVICKKIGINDKVSISYTRGNEVVTEIKEKWQLISSHTARRSGATNLMRTGRLGIQEIMQITGHTSEKSFKRYIRTTKEDNARHLAGDNFFRK
jgi:integrase